MPYNAKKLCSRCPDEKNVFTPSIAHSYYDAIKRPGQNEFATHCHADHDLENDIEMTILDYDIGSLEERERVEDRFICRIQTREPTGMNT